MSRSGSLGTTGGSGRTLTPWCSEVSPTATADNCRQLPTTADNCRQLPTTADNCRQLPNGRLRALDVGSVVLFGSLLSRRFVLDTCLVIANATPYNLHCPPKGVTQSLSVFVFEPLDSKPDTPDSPLILDDGATADRPVNGMFSFVPARPHESDGPWGFARPAIEVPGIAPPRSSRAATTNNLAAEELVIAWRAVADQVL
jgi:hypothetical protein